jgi:hypothetical protein
MQTRQFYDGALMIEVALREFLALRGIASTGHNFRWHRGQPLPPVPDHVSLEVSLVGLPAQEIVLRREQIEASSRALPRDVSLALHRLIETLNPSAW